MSINVYEFIHRNVYVGAFFISLRKIFLFKYLVCFGRRYLKDVRESEYEWFEFNDSVVNANVQKNNFVIHLI